jgi:LuxR family transcriptional regulator, quorum-sensing system regulator SdiA
MASGDINEDLFQQELNELRGLCPKGFGMGLRVRFGKPLLTFDKYDPEWVKTYWEGGYILRDPRIAWAVGNEGAIRWSGIDHPDPHGIMKEARGYGMIYGVLYAVGKRDCRTIATSARDDREFTDEEISNIHRIIKTMHKQSAPEVTLTAPQRDALAMIAEGWKYYEATDRLGIAEGALKARLVTVRKALGVDTTQEAILKAREMGLI